MSQWLVTQGDNQFSVEGLDELEQLAHQGDLSAGDMIQPPGTSEWIYVSEVDELRTILEARGIDEDVDIGSYRGAAAGMALAGTLALGLIAMLVIGGGAIFYLAQQLPRGDERLLGAGGLAFSEMILTEEGSGLWAEPDKNASMAQALPKDSVLDLLAKRGDWYRARSKSGQEGWLPEDHVIPMYQLGGADVKEEYDPLYNPDRYVEVINARWMQLPTDDPRDKDSKITNFEFVMKNDSIYPMTGLVIQATIKDAKGHELETVEIPIDGLLPPEGRTMVGTLLAEEQRRPAPDAEPQVDLAMTTFSFEEMARDEPDLQLRWVSGVEVEMQTEDDDFTNAEIDIIELRAVPNEDASEVVSQGE